MPVYKIGADIYDIPEEKVTEFETQFPNATQEYRFGEDVYDIPLGKRKEFEAQYLADRNHEPYEFGQENEFTKKMRNDAVASGVVPVVDDIYYTGDGFQRTKVPYLPKEYATIEGAANAKAQEDRANVMDMLRSAYQRVEGVRVSAPDTKKSVDRAMPGGGKITNATEKGESTYIAPPIEDSELAAWNSDMSKESETRKEIYRKATGKEPKSRVEVDAVIRELGDRMYEHTDMPYLDRRDDEKLLAWMTYNPKENSVTSKEVQGKLYRPETVKGYGGYSQEEAYSLAGQKAPDETAKAAATVYDKKASIADLKEQLAAAQKDNMKLINGIRANYYRERGGKGNIPPTLTGGLVQPEDLAIDRTSQDIMATQRLLHDTQGIIEAAEKGDGRWENLKAGAKKGLEAWNPFGAFDGAVDAGRILELSIKVEKGEELTMEEDALMNALAMNVVAGSMLNDDISSWYTGGRIVSEMVPFVAEMALSSFSGTSRRAAMAALKYAAKKGVGKMGRRFVARAAGAIGAAAGGYAMAATTGAGQVAEGTLRRMTGEAMPEMIDGEYKVINFLEASKDDAPTAFAKEWTAQAIERGTELAGGEFLTKGLSKVGRKALGIMPGGQKFLKGYQRFMSGKYGQAYQAFANKTKYTGPLDEYLEEIEAGVLNAGIVGDEKLEDFFKAKNQEAIIIGVALPGVVMQTLNTGIGVASGSFKAGAAERYKMQRGDMRAKEAWGDYLGEWQTYKMLINTGSIEEVENILADINQNEDLTPEQKLAAMEYGIYNLQFRAAMGTREAMDQGVTTEVDKMLRDIYSTAYASDPSAQGANESNKRLAEAESAAKIALGMQQDESIEEYMGERDIDAVSMGDEDLKDALTKYFAAKAEFEGRRDRYQAEVDSAYRESDKSIDSNANKVNPAMTYSTEYNGEHVFITGGNVVLNEDNTIDDAKSSETLYIKHPDGRVEPVTADKIVGEVTADDTEGLKAANRAEIDAYWQSEFANAEAQNGEVKGEGAVADDTTDNGAPTGDNVAPVAPVENNEPAPVELPDVPDFFRLGGTNYKVASRNDDGSVDVIVDGKRETLPAGTDYSTLMPTDKKGEVQYEQMPVERTHEYFVQKVKDDEARAEMIEKRRKKAEAERKKFDKKPDPGIDPDAYEAKMTQWEVDKKAAQAKVDYWNEIAKREAEITRSETREAVNNIKPDVVEETADEFIANQLAGIKITPESFKRETGLSNAEQAQLVGVISNDGVSVERAAEIITENYDSELKALGFTGDMQDVRDIIIDVLSQGNPRSYARKGREAREAENMDQQRADAEAWAKGAFDMKLEELYLYEETILPRIIRDYEGFDENEYYSNLAENNGYDTTRESESVGRGSELLQGEQPVPASGAPVVGQRNEGGAVSDDVQGDGQNGVAQEEVPVSEPVGNSEQLSSSEFPNNQSVVGLEGYSTSEILDLVKGHIFEALGEDVRIVDMRIIGSRTNGTNNSDSDLDVLVEYEGDISEDSFFNAVNDEEGALYIDGIRVDINPITKDKSGSIEQWMNRNKGYSKAEGNAPGQSGVYADNQGNPVDADGKLIVDEVNSIDEITDEDFETPTRNVQLAAIPENVANAIGTNGRPVVIKKNVFEKNGNTHVELEPEDSRNILRSALYNPNLVGSTQPIRRPDYKVAIRTGEQNAVVVLDVYQEKDFVEIVGWRMVNEKGLAKMQRQAEREGGQFLILSPNDGSAAALSALPLGLSSASEDRNSVSNSQENTQKSGEIAENGGETSEEQRGKSKEESESAPEIQEPRSVEENLDNGDKRITNYNSRGEVATVAIERDGKVVSVDSYDEGVLFEHTEYDGNGKATSVTRYDKQGNVVGTQVYEDGKAKTPMQKLADQVLVRAEEKRRIPLRERARELEAQVGVKANIIESLDEVKNREARKRIAAGEAVAGWYSGGQVYLYMPNIKDRREIELTYVHEVVAHHGVKKLLGERFNEFLDGVWNMMSEADRARMLAYVGANENPALQDMRAAADEYVAELAEKMNLGELEQSTWEKIVDWFKELLENIGFENLTKEDIESMLKASYSNLRAESGKGKIGSAENDFRARMTFHGSGAQFDRFDHAFMGTGEGNQAFGWGTYVTEAEGIGKQYAEVGNTKLSPLKAKIGNIENALRLLDLDVEKAERELEQTNNETAKERAKYTIENAANRRKALYEEKDAVEKEMGRFGRNLYSVEIPDDNGSNYLHWEDVVPKKVETAVKERLLERLSEGQGEAYKSDLKQELDDVFRYSDFDGASLYRNISAYLGGDKQASLFLNDMGFVGISYPAEAMTGGRADGARNYVIFNENDAQIKDRTMFRISRTSQEFDATQAEAVEKRGIVATGLNEAVVNVVDVPRHDFTGNLKEARAKAKEWAIENYTGKEFDLPENAGKYVISKNAIAKYLDKSAFDKSENAAVHLSVLKELPNVISNSIEAEIHADYSKGVNGERSAENGVNRNDLLVHRIYGAVNIDGKTYRVKTTIHEFRDANTANTPHSYEVTKIELIEDSTVTPNDGINNPLNRSVNSISATKLLEGVEKSYDKGKKVLDESENSSENPQDAESGIRFRTRPMTKEEARQMVRELIVPFAKELREEQERAQATEDSGTRFRKVGNTENNSIFASTYKTEDGKDINYTSERTEGYGVQDDGIGNSNSGSRRSILQRQTDTGVPGADSGLDAEKGEFCVVERVFTENGAFNFTSGEKIESADDVAYIFSALEDAAKEHSFVVYVKDGMPTVVELGMGSFNATMVDVPTASLAYSRINPDHVYFVHNHPSGNLICSSQDVAMLRVFEDMSDVPVTGVIINLKTGKYGTFDTERHSVIGEKRVPEKEVKLAVHTLDKQIFAPDYDPMAQPLVRGSQDVAQFLNSQRMGDRPKVSFLILSRANRIIGNIHTPFTNITTDVEAVGRYINERVIQFGGENAILYGDFAITSVEGMDFRLLQNAMDRFGKTNLLDVVRVEGNFTRSANDMGLLYEPEAEYKDGQTMFRFIGEKGAANLDNAEEATTRLDNLAVAREMESAGKEAKAIKLATGWERGADGKWRYETEDYTLNQDAKVYDVYNGVERPFSDFFVRDGARGFIDTDYSLRLDELINDKELFAAYPELEQFFVSVERLASGTMGELNFDDKVIRLGRERVHLVPNVINGKRSYKVEVGSVLAHEIQHAIQHIEGFALGGNPYMAGQAVRANLPEKHQKAYGILASYDFMPLEKARQWAEHPDAAIIDEAEPLKALIADVDAGKVKWEDIPNWFSNDFNNYRRLAGEVESRNVQNRMGLTPEERRESLAKETEDVARKDQIFIYDALESASEGYIPSDEYEVLRQAVMRNNSLYGKNKPVETAFTANNFYIYNNYGDDNFSVIETIPIVGNEDLIEFYNNSIQNGTYRNNEDFSKAAAAFRGQQEQRNSGERNAPEQRREDAGPVSVDLRQSSERGGDNAQGDSNERGTKEARFRTIAEVERIDSESVKAIEGLSQELNTPAEVVTDIESIADERKKRDAKKGMKGWFDPKTGKVVVVLPNVSDTQDAVETMLHEAVGHRGLRALFGKRYNDFLNQVFAYGSKEMKKAIMERAFKERARGTKNSMRVATEEYLAEIAEVGFVKAPRLWEEIIGKMKSFLRSAGIGIPVSERELGYMLWRSYQILKKGDNLESRIADSVMQQRMEVGEYRRRDGRPVSPTRSKGRALESEKKIEVANIRASYEETVKGSWYQSLEAMQDSMLSLKEFYELLAKKTGKAVPDHMNAYYMENALSSANQAQTDAFARFFFKRVVDRFTDLTDQGVKEEEIYDYLMVKHGIERNREMAVRKSLTSEEYGLDRKKFKKYVAKKKELLKRAEQEKWEWEKTQKELDVLAEAYGADLKEDYSGLSAIFPKAKDFYKAAYDYVLALDKRASFKYLQDAVRECNETILHKRYVTGMISKKVYEEIQDMYEYYVPLRGFDETTSDEVYAYLDSNHSPIPSAKIARGRKSKADNPLAWIANQAEAAIVQGNRNMMKLALFNSVMANPNDLVSIEGDIYIELRDGKWVVSVPEIPEDASPEEIQEKMSEHTKKMKKLAKDNPELVKRVSDNADIPYTVVQNSNLKQHQVFVRRNGKLYTMTVNANPRLAMAVNGLTNPNSRDGDIYGFIAEKAQIINSALSKAYTTANPNFVASNWIRDMIYSNSMVWVKESPEYARRFNRNCGLNAAGVYKLLMKYEEGRLDLNDHIEGLFYEFMMNGGETGYTKLKDYEAQKEELRKMLNSNGAKDVAKCIGGALVLVNRAVENAARFAAYRTSREMGRSITRSIFDAKEISVNFNKKGAGFRFFGTTGQTKAGNAAALVSAGGRSGYVFWNAGVQGMANFIKAVYGNKVKGAALILGMFALGSLMALLAGDDDEYHNMSPYVRRSNVCLHLFGDIVISIPLPIEYRAIYGMGEYLTNVWLGKEEFSAITLAEQLSQLLPLDMLEGGGGFKAFVPSLAKPIYEASTNVDWQGMPIANQHEYNKFDPEYQRVFKNAFYPTVLFSQALSEFGGGNENRRSDVEFMIGPLRYEPFEWNPEILENTLRGYFGGYFSFPMEVVKTGEMIFGDREFDFKNIPVLNRVIKTSSDKAEEYRINKEYYDNLHEYEKDMYELEGFLKDVEDIKKTPEERERASERVLEIINTKENADTVGKGERLYELEGYKVAIDDMNRMYKESGEDVFNGMILERKKMFNKRFNEIYKK